MARKLFNACLIIIAVVLSSCTDKYEFMAGIDQIPAYYEPVGDDLVNIFDEDGNLIEDNVPHILSITTDSKKVHGGKKPLELKTSSISINKDGIYPVKYAVENVEYFYNVTIQGYVMKYMGKEITPKYEVAVSITEDTNIVENNPFLQKFTSNNELLYRGSIVISSAEQEIEINEELAVLEKVVLVNSEHIRFIRTAEIENSKLLVRGVNRATFEEHWSNDSLSTVNVDYNLEYIFNISAPSEIVTETSSVIGQTFTVTEGTVSIAGNNFTFTYSNTNCDTVEYKGTDYTSQVLKCNPEVKTIKVINANSIEICAYEDNADDYAKATMSLTISDPEATIEEVEWNYTHTSFLRNATVNGNSIIVTCDNNANFVDIYSDGSRRNEETVTYRVNNTFTVSGLNFEVANINDVLNRTYNFVNGSVAIGGNNVVISHSSPAAVVGNVMHNNTNYASQITPCVVEARTITFTNESQAVIRFYDNNANDYAEAIVEANITEQITVREIRKTFQHIAFNNAIVNGNMIAIPCNNNATFVKVYSNNTEENAVNVGYVWNNYFTVNMPEFYSHNMNGQTYYFNAGTTVVDGKNVTVSFSSREVSDIYFENQNYKNEAPVCTIQPESVTFREGFADITFREGNETVTATVTVSYRTAETVTGQIVAGWMTDSFMNQHQNYEGTYLHIMASVNGAYVIYSRRQNTTAWTTTNLSATEGANLLSSGRAAAWVYNGSSYIMGSVTAIAREDVQDRWILEYYLLNGQLAYRLGKNAETIMGGIYRHPVRKVATNNNGIWEINGQIFAGSN